MGSICYRRDGRWGDVWLVGRWGASIRRQAVPLSQNNKGSYRETLTPSLDPAITIPFFLSQHRDPAMSMSLLSAHLEQISISCQGIDSLPYVSQLHNSPSIQCD